MGWRTDQEGKLDRKQRDECIGEGTGGRCHLSRGNGSGLERGGQD